MSGSTAVPLVDDTMPGADVANPVTLGAGTYEIIALGAGGGALDDLLRTHIGQGATAAPTVTVQASSSPEGRGARQGSITGAKAAQ